MYYIILKAVFEQLFVTLCVDSLLVIFDFDGLVGVDVQWKVVSVEAFFLLCYLVDETVDVLWWGSVGANLYPWSIFSPRSDSIWGLEYGFLGTYAFH